MDEIARLILDALEQDPDARRMADLRERVATLCGAFPIYTWLARPVGASDVQPGRAS